MIIVMGPMSTKENLEKVEQKIVNSGLRYHLSTGESRTIVGVIGDKKLIADLLELSQLQFSYNLQESVVHSQAFDYS